jgi:plastocyanin
MKSGTYTHTFDTAGSFSYHCTLHTGMTGPIKVSDSAAP